VTENALLAEVARRRRAAGLDGDADLVEADRGDSEPNALLRVVARRRRAASGSGANPLLALVEKRRAAAGLTACAR
jgi:hypothetical protein